MLQLLLLRRPLERESKIVVDCSPSLWLRRRRLALDFETAADDDIGVAAAGGDGVAVVLLVALLPVCAAVAS
jgi:hypothetical protein